MLAVFDPWVICQAKAKGSWAWAAEDNVSVILALLNPMIMSSYKLSEPGSAVNLRSQAHNCNRQQLRCLQPPYTHLDKITDTCPAGW